MWTMAAVFALAYALPEFAFFFVWTGSVGILYSSAIGAICAIVMSRLAGKLRIALMSLAAILFAFPLYLIVPNWGLGIDFSAVIIGRLIWFGLAPQLLIVAQRHLAKQESLDRTTGDQ